jgi:hypothetical protein
LEREHGKVVCQHWGRDTEKGGARLGKYSSKSLYSDWLLAMQARHEGDKNTNDNVCISEPYQKVCGLATLSIGSIIVLGGTSLVAVSKRKFPKWKFSKRKIPKWKILTDNQSL